MKRMISSIIAIVVISMPSVGMVEIPEYLEKNLEEEFAQVPSVR